MSSSLQHAQVLISQERWDLAEKSLRQALAAHPEDSLAHALLALSLSNQEKYADALTEAKEAISRSPDAPFVHYVLGNVLVGLDRYRDAMASAEEAIRLEPENADYHGLLAAVLLLLGDPKGSLEASERGLAIDAENVGCANSRAMALTRLGRQDEAGETLATALANAPENALTHANRGWTYLHEGKTEMALEHFREALRLDPHLEWARDGIVAALRARYSIYGWILKYYLWMSRLGSKAQWGFVMGGVIASLIIRAAARSSPELGLVLWPLFGLYAVFCLLTWIANPLFNLLLRLNRFGRLALTPAEISASNALLALFLVAVGFAVKAAVLGDTDLLIAGLVTVAMALPISVTFQAERGRGRIILGAYTLGLAAVGAVGVWGLLAHTGAVGALGLFFLAWFSFQLVANAMLLRG